MHCYIAAPFFTTPELLVVERIEQELNRAGIAFYSPRNADKQFGKRSASMLNLNKPEIRKIIFDDNYNAIKECEGGKGFMLAWLDRQLKHPSLSVRLVQDQMKVVSGPLTQPDIGTVWEMGAAFALNIPVLGLTLTAQGTKMNVMLLEGMTGLIWGWPDLHGFCQSKDRPADQAKFLTKYEGSFSEQEKASKD